MYTYVPQELKEKKKSLCKNYIHTHTHQSYDMHTPIHTSGLESVNEGRWGRGREWEVGYSSVLFATVTLDNQGTSAGVPLLSSRLHIQGRWHPGKGTKHCTASIHAWPRQHKSLRHILGGGDSEVVTSHSTCAVTLDACSTHTNLALLPHPNIGERKIEAICIFPSLQVQNKIEKNQAGTEPGQAPHKVHLEDDVAADVLPQFSPSSWGGSGRNPSAVTTSEQSLAQEAK